MELLLIRHALPMRVETQDGTPADPPLSETGHVQAARLAQWLAEDEIHAIYTSPMQRARETAAPLAKALGLDPRLEPDVVELDHLSDAYVPLEEIKAADREHWLELVRGGLYAHVDLPAFRRNVTGALARIASEHRSERVAVVCHGGVINAWAGAILGIGDDQPFFFLDAGYTSISRFLVARTGERSVVSLNETAHLRALAHAGARSRGG